MEINKNMKSGYQGKPDAMREKAERLLNHPGSAKDVYPSKSAADNERMRAFKKGGSVKKDKDKDKDCPKFAMGGVAKIRHGEATKQGMPRNFKKNSVKDFL